MVRREPFTIRYNEATVQHLLSIEQKYHNLIRSFIIEQLTFDPDVETRNRKPLRQPAPFDATWELRCGPNNRFRVLYGIDFDQHEVQIHAIGTKIGNRLVVGKLEIKI